MVNLKVSGKVFLLGEYSVVAGNPAIIAATRPQFILCSKSDGLRGGEQERPCPFHPHSPVGKLHQWAEERLQAQGHSLLEFGLSFEQLVWTGAQGSGLGSSTAEFAAYYLALCQQASLLRLDPSWKGAYILYRELHGKDPVPPSGGDLVAQMVGGVIEFTPDRFWRGDMEGALKDLPIEEGFKGFPVLLFTIEKQVGRKVATHQHLPALKAQGFFTSSLIKELHQLTRTGSQAIRQKNWIILGECFTSFAQQLYGAGLELETTTEDRKQFLKLPGVLGAKGMGALQADGILLTLNPEITEAEFIEVIRTAEARKLTCHLDGDSKTHSAGWVQTLKGSRS